MPYNHLKQMRKETIDKLCCPFDRQDLALRIYTQNTEGNILEGVLSCAACARAYPIVHGIPIMSPDEYRQPGLEQPILQAWESAHKKIG